MINLQNFVHYMSDNRLLHLELCNATCYLMMSYICLINIDVRRMSDCLEYFFLLAMKGISLQAHSWPQRQSTGPILSSLLSPSLLLLVVHNTSISHIRLEAVNALNMAERKKRLKLFFFVWCIVLHEVFLQLTAH